LGAFMSGPWGMALPDKQLTWGPHTGNTLHPGPYPTHSLSGFFFPYCCRVPMCAFVCTSQCRPHCSFLQIVFGCWLDLASHWTGHLLNQQAE
jgi:hypothetical protein